MSAAIRYLRTDNYVFPLSTRTLASLRPRVPQPGVTQILVGNPRHHLRPCVEILVSRRATSVLEGLMYASTCSTVPMEPTAGTREMVQAALKYVCKTYPHIKKFELADETHVRTPSGLQFITPRRLLTGRPGYFQEHFGAEPSAATRTLLRGMREKGDRSKDILADASMEAICEHAKSRGLPSGCLFGTTWTISRATVEAYAVGEPTLSDAATTGGASRRHSTWLAAAAPRSVRPLRHALSPLDAGL
jgi:hypothetical protein